MRFRDDKGYVLYPQIGDRLDLICPASDPAEYEYYKLYLVSSREQADRCEVTDPPNLLLTCDKPNSYMRFTIKFQEYSPNLWGHEFKTMHDYYIIALKQTKLIDRQAEPINEDLKFKVRERDRDRHRAIRKLVTMMSSRLGTSIGGALTGFQPQCERRAEDQ
ncbi:hypothetical protein Z043_104328 [Scleropages formosus]|uniref:Ephrin RBD domain-containing protein n=1 Tax=Scleropages formosus TaxID=113540 RepID=A0A0P7V140_SCLFO|nr:hypothetical protein Z043_104328 [Scleropages formosus]